MNTETEEKEVMDLIKRACDNLVNKVISIAKDTDNKESVSLGARLTLAYFLKYGILDIEKFITIDAEKNTNK